MPRNTSRDGLQNKLQYWALSSFPRLWSLVNRTGWLGDRINGFLINNLVRKTRERPNPLSTLAPYSSWESLTDRTWFGRHLPPRKGGNFHAKEAASLLVRPSSGTRFSDKSTPVFAAFAQWFTDGFLLTSDSDRRRTTTNHQIDFSPLYGLNKPITDCLRLHSNQAGQKGRLKSQMIANEEPRVGRYGGACNIFTVPSMAAVAR
jgi:prostaglandin-endoperoxide synthase 2